MQKYKYVGKTKEEALSKAIEELNLQENEYYVEEQEVKQGLFKGKSIEIEIIKKEDIIIFIKEFLSNLTKNMGLDVKIESKDLARNLRDCSQVVLFAATLGAQCDQLIRRAQVKDQVKALPYALKKFSGSEKFNDDITYIILKKLVK